MKSSTIFTILLVAGLSATGEARKLNVENSGKSCNFDCSSDADCTPDCAYCFLGACFYFPKSGNDTTDATKEDGCVQGI